MASTNTPHYTSCTCCTLLWGTSSLVVEYSKNPKKFRVHDSRPLKKSPKIQRWLPKWAR